MGDGRVVHIYRMNEYDWWAGESYDACVAAFKEWNEFTDEELREDLQSGSTEPLADAELDRLRYIDDDCDSESRSFREELARSSEEIQAGRPFFFASTEW